MQFIIRTLFLLALVSSVALPVHAADGYPNTYNIYLAHNVEAHQWAALAQYDVLVLEASFEDTNPGGLATLRSLNPDIILLGFVPINGTFDNGNELTPGTINYMKWHGFNDGDFWLYDTTGNVVSDWPGKWTANITSQSPLNAQGETSAEWLARFIYEEVWLNGPGWDGIFTDDTWDHIAWLNDFIDNPIDANRDGTADTEEQINTWWREGNEACVNALRAHLGPNVPFVGNGHNTFHSAMNGAMLENFPTFGSAEQGNPYGYAWSKWMFNTLGSYAMGDNYLTHPQHLMMINGGWADGTTDEPDTTGRFHAHKRFTLASTLLKDGYYCLNRAFAHNTIWWQPEFDMYLGAPLGPFTIEVVDGKTVYMRHYEAASVAVNPNNDPVTGEYGFPSIGDWDAYIGPPFTYTPPPDTTPPNPVTQYSGYVVDHQSFVVEWQAVGDDGAAGFADHYEIKHYSQPILTEERWDAATLIPQSLVPAGAGVIQELLVEGLAADTRYYVAVRAVDEVGQRGALHSYSPSFITLSAPVNDTQPPNSVRNLDVASIAGLNITLGWDAPGDDGEVGVASAYEARWSRSPIDAGNFSAANEITGLPDPVVNNEYQETTFSGVNAETPLFVALRAVDDAGNWGDLSNILEIQDDVFPAIPVADLAVTDSTDSSLVMTFTAPDNPGGGVVAYYFRHMVGSEFDPADWESGQWHYSIPAETPGATAVVEIDGLDPDTQHAFLMRTYDSTARLSEVSNLAVAWTLPDTAGSVPAPDDTTGPAVVNDMYVTGLGHDFFTVDFGAPADDLGTVVAYDLRYVTSNTFPESSWDAATSFPVDPPRAPGEPESITLDSLLEETWYSIRIRSQDDSGNWSALSEALSVKTDVAPPPPPPPAPVDSTGPATITDLTVSGTGIDYLDFSFTAPEDSMGSVTDYDLRYVEGQTFPESAWDLAPSARNNAPLPAGSPETLSVTGLDDNTWYTARIKSKDDAGNWSDLSEPASGQTDPAPPADPADTTGPNTITGLRYDDAGYDFLVFEFIAPSDNEGQVIGYDMRYVEGGSFPESAWDGATPVPTGDPREPEQPELITINGLEDDRTYSVRVRSQDDSYNWSALSPAASGQTLEMPPPPPPPPPAPDNDGPAVITDLAAMETGVDSIRLGFTAPEDSAGTVVVYDLRYVVGQDLSEAQWEAAQAVPMGTPQSPGEAESVTLFELTADTWYSLRIRSRDDSENWSALSEVLTVKTNPVDENGPAAVADLSVAASTESTLVVSFTAPADDYGTVVEYDLRYRSNNFPQGAWLGAPGVNGEPAPQEPGSAESILVPGLNADATYAFRLKSRDSAGNWSNVSNQAVGTTDTVYVPPPPPPPPPAPEDTTGPAEVTDLQIMDTGETTLTLGFTAPQDAEGDVVEYDLRFVQGQEFPGEDWEGASPLPIAPGVPGNAMERLVTDLDPGTDYAFRMKSRDDSGNWSGLSNTAWGATDTVYVPPPPPVEDIFPPNPITDLTVASMTETTMVITFTTPEDSLGVVADFDVRYVQGAEFPETDWESAVPLRIGVSPSFPRVEGPESGTLVSATVLGLSPGTTYAYRGKVADDSGNWSELSDPVAATTDTVVTPPPPPDDEIGPKPVTDLEVAATGDNSMAVTFTAPTDDEGTVVAYDLRFIKGVNLSSEDWSNAELVNLSVGTTSVQVFGLQPGTVYAFRMQSQDDSGNWSDLSNVASDITDTLVTPPPPPPPPYPWDYVPPHPVTDLTAEADEDGVVTLRWTAVEDPGKEWNTAAYDLRWRHGSLDSTTWAEATHVPVPAPLPPGSEEILVLDRWSLPESGTVELSFAMTVSDSSGNVSHLSNIAHVSISAPEPPPDVQPPSVVANLRAESSEDAVQVQWDAVPDADLHFYRVYRRTEPEAAFTLLGTRLDQLAYTDDDVQPGETYEYMVTAVDWSGNESGHSQSVSVRVPEPIDKWAPDYFLVTAPSPNPVQEQLQLTLKLGEATNVRVDIVDVQGRSVYSEVQSMERGEHVWSWNRNNGTRGQAVAGMYWLRIQAMSQVTTYKVLLLP